MIRVVIDTNVLVSALFDERPLPRLAIDAGKAADAMARIRAIVSIVSPAVRVAAASDPDDNHFLECAEATHITSLPEIFVISLRFGKKLES